MQAFATVIHRGRHRLAAVAPRRAPVWSSTACIQRRHAGGGRRHRPKPAAPVAKVAPPGLRRLPISVSQLHAILEAGSSEGPLAAYQKLISEGALEVDTAQATCAHALQRLFESLVAHSKELARWQMAHELWQSEHAAWAERQTAWEAEIARIRAGHAQKQEGKQGAAEPSKEQENEPAGPGPAPQEPERPTAPSSGSYIFGGVGAGKSLLMDLFVECCERSSAVALEPRRVHFHEFMLEVHQELHRLRQQGGEKHTRTVAQHVASQTQLLAFDEFQITNISDALIVETLFSELFRSGVVTLMTSNRPPQDLYKNGLNRHLAIPQLLAALDRFKVEFVELAAARDFRAAPTTEAVLRDFFCKKEITEKEAESQLRSAFEQAAGQAKGEPVSVTIGWSRKMAVDEAAAGVARFTFSQLCAAALNADDYLHLAKHFHTFVVSDVPRFKPEQHNEARRFTNLVDCLYEQHARLILSAESQPERLLERMTEFATAEARTEDRPGALQKHGPGAVGGGANAEGMLGTGSSEWVRQSPFTPQFTTIEEAMRAARSTGAQALEAGDDDTATGAEVAGVMAGAAGALQESGFAARRAISRLLHMQTEEYLLAHQRNRVHS